MINILAIYFPHDQPRPTFFETPFGLGGAHEKEVGNPGSSVPSDRM
jgi:hypothetical protein